MKVITLFQQPPTPSSKIFLSQMIFTGLLDLDASSLPHTRNAHILSTTRNSPLVHWHAKICSIEDLLILHID